MQFSLVKLLFELRKGFILKVFMRQSCNPGFWDWFMAKRVLTRLKVRMCVCIKSVTKRPVFSSLPAQCLKVDSFINHLSPLSPSCSLLSVHFILFIFSLLFFSLFFLVCFCSQAVASPFPCMMPIYSFTKAPTETKVEDQLHSLSA